MGVGWPEISTAFFCANYGTMIWETLSCGGIYLFNVLQARRHLDQGLVGDESYYGNGIPPMRGHFNSENDDES